MTQEEIETLQVTSYFIEEISKHIVTLRNAEGLYIVTGYSLNTSFQDDETLAIPDFLAVEFKQKLEKFYLEKLGEYIKKLNTLKL